MPAVIKLGSYELAPPNDLVDVVARPLGELVDALGKRVGFQVKHALPSLLDAGMSAAPCCAPRSPIGTSTFPPPRP